MLGAVDNPYFIQGDTPLHWAGRWGHTSAAEALLAAGAHVNAPNKNVINACWAVAAAALAPFLACVALLDQDAFAQGDTPLDRGVYWNNLDASVALARAGGKIVNNYIANSKEVSRLWCLRPRHLQARALLQRLATSQRWEECQLLVQAGADAVSM